jgi:hypothetical protein
MENTLKQDSGDARKQFVESLREKQTEDIKLLASLKAKMLTAENEFLERKTDYLSQQTRVEQNARALKAFEPRKPRAKKTPKES